MNRTYIQDKSNPVLFNKTTDRPSDQFPLICIVLFGIAGLVASFMLFV